MSPLLSSLSRATLSLALVGLGAHAARLQAENVEVVFTSGERAYGELLSQNDAEVDITRIVYTRSRVISSQASYPRQTVASVIPVPSLLDYYKKRADTTPDTYAAQYALARWCFERGLQDQAFIHAKAIYDQDPTDESSQALLKEIGYVQDDGQWVKESAYAAKHNLVTFDGRLMTQAQVDLRRADLKAQLLVSTGNEHALTLANAVLNDQHRIKEEEARLADLAKQEAEDKAQNQAANQGQGQGGGRRNQQQQQQQGQDASGTDDDTAAEKKEIQGAIDSAKKQLESDQKAVSDYVPELAKLEAAATAAHQAYVATLPADEQARDAARLKAEAKPTPVAPAGKDGAGKDKDKDSDSDK